MPLGSWDLNNLTSELLPGRLPEGLNRDETANPGFIDTAAAALRQSNIVSNLYDYAQEPAVPAAQAGYDALSDIAGFEDHADRFFHSGSPVETQIIKQRIRSEMADRRTLGQAGAWGTVANLSAALIDPLTLASMAIPVVAPVAWGSRAVRVGAGVAANAAIDIGEETALHQLQETRTLGESAFRVGAGALLTAGFGALASRIPKSEFEKMRSDLNQTLREVPNQQTLSAMRVGGNTTLHDESIATVAGRAIAATIGRISPILRLFRSGTKEARVLTQELADVPFMLNKNIEKGEGTALSAETRIQQRELQSRITAVQTLETSYKAYRAKNPTNAITMRDFGRQLAGAMRRGDQHVIPEVATAAQQMRKLFEADKKIFQDLGALPEEIDLLGAKSYFPRVYDHAAIAADEVGLREKLTDWFRRNPKASKEAVESADAVKKLEKQHQELRSKVRALGEDAEQALHEQVAQTEQKLVEARRASTEATANAEVRDAAEVQAAVHDTLDRIMGTVRGTADIGHVSNPRTLKARTLDVPDEILEPYLISDFEQVMNGYARSVAPQIELRTAFGSITLENELKVINEAYQVKRAAMTSEKAISASRKEQARVVKDLVAIRDRLLGQVGPRGSDGTFWIRSARLVRAYNYVTKLGSQTLSSFSDYGHVITRYGLARTMAKTARFLTSIAANKLIREDAKRMGTALDWLIDTRSGTLADIGDELAGSRMLDRGAQWATNKFTRISGMATWNSSIKAITSALEQDAILRAVQKGADIKPFELAKLAQNGIGATELKRIGAQFEKYGEDTDGLFRARTDLWDDREMAKLLEDSIVKTANIMSIRKGVGDLPVMMNSEMARTLLQFKSFGMAAVNRIMIPVAQGLSHGDAATINGFLSMIALGGLTYVAKEWAAGREPDLTPARLSAESLNWSGVLGYLPDVLDPATGLLPPPIRGMRFSRYSDRTPIQTLLGPSLGTATQLYQTVAGVTDLGISQKDLHAVRQAFVPMQNVFYLRRLFNALEGEAGEAIGAEGSTHETFIHRVTKTEKPKK